MHKYLILNDSFDGGVFQFKQENLLKIYCAAVTTINFRLAPAAVVKWLYVTK